MIRDGERLYRFAAPPAPGDTADPATRDPPR
jgi:hypothetical protein